MNRSEAKKREADREQFQKGFPGCRFRGATVIADDSPAEGEGFEPSVPPARVALIATRRRIGKIP
jgi:hypothetical protein